jgi:integrase
VELALASGLRRNELFALEWRWFNIDERTVRVVRQLHKQRPEFVIPKSKKARTTLVLPSWWDHHDPDASGLVLSMSDGTMVMPQGITRLFRRLLEEAGVYRMGVGLHTFRHTYARNFIEGVRGDFGLLQKSLGHKSIVTTEKLYGHFHDDRAAGIARSRIYPDERLRAG